jgi:hypothetical protein
MKKLFLAIFAVMTCMVLTAKNTVKVNFNGSTATVTIDDNIKDFVTCSSGTSSHVSLVQAETVTDSNPGEITYELSGNSDNGGFELQGSYKCTIKLAGLTLTNPEGAAINIDDGKRIELNASKETTNTLADGANGNWKACIYAKGHFELKGKGTLIVTGNTAHAISCKEYMQVKNLTLNITGAKKDGLHCQQYFWMQGGTVNISGAKANGIKVELDGKTPTEIYPDHENGDDDEDTGNCYLDDGKLTISNCDGNDIWTSGQLVVSGGTHNYDVTKVSQNNATGITTLRNEFTPDEAVIYDLNGRLIDMLDGRKGVFIIRKDNEIRKVIVQ